MPESLFDRVNASRTAGALFITLAEVLPYDESMTEDGHTKITILVPGAAFEFQRGDVRLIRGLNDVHDGLSAVKAAIKPHMFKGLKNYVSD